MVSATSRFAQVRECRAAARRDASVIGLQQSFRCKTAYPGTNSRFHSERTPPNERETCVSRSMTGLKRPGALLGASTHGSGLNFQPARKLLWPQQSGPGAWWSWTVAWKRSCSCRMTVAAAGELDGSPYRALIDPPSGIPISSEAHATVMYRSRGVGGKLGDDALIDSGQGSVLQ